MYKIISEDLYHYPYVILELINITTSEKGLWCYWVELHDELCEQYHVKRLDCVIMDELPEKGGWITEEEVRKL